jgi:Ca2+-binding EF-hand superfamily protein
MPRPSGSASFAGKIFDALDTKKQGYLSETEIQAALTSGQTTSSSAKNVLTALDADGDGKVTKAEFTDAIDKMAQQLGDQMLQARMAHGRPPQGAPPQGAPAPDAGGMTKDQLSVMAADEKAGSSGAQGLKALVASFDQADTDGDGKVSFEEARAFSEQKQTSDTAATTPTGDAAQRFLRVIAEYLSSGNTDSNSLGIGSSVKVTA